MGLENETMEDIFSVTIAFLHASNITFSSLSADESQVDDGNVHLEPYLKLLGLDRDKFNEALCYYTITVGRDSIKKPLSREKAELGLEALNKAAYGALFDYLVQEINKRISYKPRAGERSGKVATIGVLDIFGFEIFKNNSFEQLCINYCNEVS